MLHPTHEALPFHGLCVHKDGVLAEGLLRQACCKLKDSAAFDRGDTQPLNALGEVFVAVAERQLSEGNVEGASASLQSAIDEGYQLALHLKRDNSDALVRRHWDDHCDSKGCNGWGGTANAKTCKSKPFWLCILPQVGTAEVMALRGRMARDAGDASSAASLFSQAAGAYGEPTTTHPLPVDGAVTTSILSCVFDRLQMVANG